MILYPNYIGIGLLILVAIAAAVLSQRDIDRK
jgi:hypothetical protein